MERCSFDRDYMIFDLLVSKALSRIRGNVYIIDFAKLNDNDRKRLKRMLKADKRLLQTFVNSNRAYCISFDSRNLWQKFLCKIKLMIGVS